MHIGIVLPSLGGGGAERAMLSLAKGLIERRGCLVDLVLLRLVGDYMTTIPAGLRLYCRNQGRNSRDLLKYCCGAGMDVKWLTNDPFKLINTWSHLPRVWSASGGSWSRTRGSLDIVRYLHQAQPDLLFSALPRANDTVTLAAEVTSHSLPVVVSIRNNVSLGYSKKNVKTALKLTRNADAVVAVSAGVAADAIETLGLEERRVHTIYNAKPISAIQRMAEMDLEHHWFDIDRPPVILTVLRGEPKGLAQKDWQTLVAAFGRARHKVPARLAILGLVSDEYKAQVLEMAKGFDVANDITFLGFDENPFRYMHRAALFVLSSRWEGLPNVLIEALACGTPVVSTDSPYGPSEILENGRWGRLTPVGDADAMAQAIVDSLRGEVVPSAALRHRAGYFSVEQSVMKHALLFDRLIKEHAHPI